MKRIAALIVMGLSMWWTFATPAAAAHGGKERAHALRASVAQVDITPSSNGFPKMFLAGYTSRNNVPAQGSVDENPLQARALAFREGDNRSKTKVIVTIDALGVPPGLRRQILDGVWQRHRLHMDDILLSASHTHSGPVLTGNLDPKSTYYGLSVDGLQGSADLDLIDRYTDWLRQALIDLVGEAIRGLGSAPGVTLSYGVGSTTFNVNRRGLSSSDTDVPVMAVRRPDGSLLAVVFGYACHALNFGFVYNADYPGVARRLVETDAKATMAFFLQGAAGDLNPISTLAYQDQGAALAAAVKNVLSGGSMQELRGHIHTELQNLDLPLQIDAADTGHASLRSLYVQGRDHFEPNGYLNYAHHANQIIDQIDRGVMPVSEPWAAHVWRFGEPRQDRRSLVLAALGGEVVSGYSVMLKSRFRDKLGQRLWVAAYSNVVPGYIPTNEVWDLPFTKGTGSEFHYEAGHPVVTNISPECLLPFCSPLTSMWGTSQMYYGWPAPLRRGNIDSGGTVLGVEEIVLRTTTHMIQHPPQCEDDDDGDRDRDRGRDR